MPQPISNNELNKLLINQQQAFYQQPLPSAAQRIAWLKDLRKILLEEQDALAAAISTDFTHRSVDETRLAELLPCLEAIDYACKRIKGWMKPSRRSVSLAFQPASAQVVYQPLGVVGASGMGHYHGYEGFLTFSHGKAVFSKPSFNATKFVYPPYGGWLQKLILKLFLR